METVDYFWAVTGVLIASVVLVALARLALYARNKKQAREIQEAAEDIEKNRSDVHEIR